MHNDGGLPDLRELESVEASDSRSAVVLSVMGGMTLWVVFLVGYGLFEYYHVMQPTDIALAGLVLALFAYIPLRILLGYTRFKTDTDGFTASGPIRTRFIPWHDINGAEIKQPRLGKTALFLRAKETTIKISPDTLGADSPSLVCLIASTWQHLRRLGRTHGMELPPAALHLWDHIPEDIPAELEWGSAPSLPAKIGAIVPLVITWGVLLVFTLLSKNSLFMLSMILGLVVMVAGFTWLQVLPESFRRAYRFRVTRDTLEGDLLLRSACVPWCNVNRAVWKGSSQLSISDIHGTEVRIPYVLGSLESEQAILAVIRQLRASSSSQAVTIPTLISKDTGFLTQPAWDTGRLRSLREAFLNTLDPPARKRLMALYAMETTAVLTGIVATGVVVFTGGLDRLSSRLHSGDAAEVLYFVPSPSLWIAVPLMMAAILLFGYSGNLVGRMLAGPYRQEWKRLQQLGNSWGIRLFAYVCAAVGVLAVFSIPLILNNYMKVTHDGVAANRFFEFRERRYTWEDVKSVEVGERLTGPRCNKRESPVFHISFSDGTDWTLDEKGAYAADAELIRGACEFILSKTREASKGNALGQEEDGLAR